MGGEVHTFPERAISSSKMFLEFIIYFRAQCHVGKHAL